MNKRQLRSCLPFGACTKRPSTQYVDENAKLIPTLLFGSFRLKAKKILFNNHTIQLSRRQVTNKNRFVADAKWYDFKDLSRACIKSYTINVQVTLSM